MRYAMSLVVLLAMGGLASVLHACGSNAMGTIPTACIAIATLPCAQVHLTPMVQAANITLTDPNGTTSVNQWQAGAIAANKECPSTDPNGPWLNLLQPGKYHLVVDANTYASASLDFSAETATCGTAPCTYSCLQTHPSPLAVTLTSN